MYILGISGGTRQGNQDASAALTLNGEIVAAIEEERISRVKHSPGRLPENAIAFCLAQAGIDIRDVSVLAAPGESYSGFEGTLGDFMRHRFGHCPPVQRFHHHDCHAASSYFASGFDKAMVVSYDLSGDSVSTQLGTGINGELSVVRRYAKPDSLGVFYSILTQVLGFKRDSDEYKVMGLASYGRRGRFDFSWLLEFGGGEYHLHSQFIRVGTGGQPNPGKQEPIYAPEVVDRIGLRRLPGSEILQDHADLAAAGQEHLENAILDMVTHLHKQTGLTRLCLAGGVALNCVVNQRLMALPWLEGLYVQPAASDAGLALGAAWLAAKAAGQKPRPMAHAYLGTLPDVDTMRETLTLSGARFTETSDPADVAAEMVARGRIVGWFQGRMEFGPRALGSRSILANPQLPDMKDTINERIKFREQFRPFAPAALEEDSPRYFDGRLPSSPYMTVTYDIHPGTEKLFPSVIHVDNTARLQTVPAGMHPLFRRYLERLKALTGHGVTLNTSFNVRGDAIVNTPYHALSTFFGCGMDDLVMGPFLLSK